MITFPTSVSFIKHTFPIRGGIMEFNEKTVGYILYAVGIVGGVEGATNARPGSSLVISIVSIVVIIIGSYLLAKK